VLSLDSLLALPSEAFRIRLLDRLVDDGYAIFPDLLRPEFADELRAEMARFRESGAFRPAGIGRGEATRAPETRRDGTLWFDPAALTPIQAKLARVIEAVREDLNAGLFLGLWDWEGHYAIYPPGAFYRKHLDRFADDSRRTVSMVFFFNPDWKEDDGGLLRLETDAGILDVAPKAGTAVFFRSDRVPHEVLETKRERFSFAGWFRTRS
jgi:SM-20-related protein